MNKSVIDMVVSQAQGLVPVAVLRAQGELNRFTYLDLMNKARDLYENGQRYLIVDMSGIRELGLTGFFALYSIATLFRGEKAVDPEGGVVALRLMAGTMHDAPHFIRLLKPQPQFLDALSTSGLPIYDDLAGAIASF